MNLFMKHNVMYYFGRHLRQQCQVIKQLHIRTARKAQRESTSKSDFCLVTPVCLNYLGPRRLLVIDSCQTYNDMLR